MRLEIEVVETQVLTATPERYGGSTGELLLQIP